MLQQFFVCSINLHLVRNKHWHRDIVISNRTVLDELQRSRFKNLNNSDSRVWEIRSRHSRFFTKVCKRKSHTFGLKFQTTKTYSSLLKIKILIREISITISKSAEESHIKQFRLAHSIDNSRTRGSRRGQKSGQENQKKVSFD